MEHKQIFIFIYIRLSFSFLFLLQFKKINYKSISKLEFFTV
jgi:hypothetical protein